MRLDICSIGQILHWSAKKSRALQLQFPLVESVSNSQLVSQHLFLNFDSIRFESIVSQGWSFDEERKQSRAITRKMFFFSPPLVNFGRFHSWNRLSIFSLFPFPFIFFTSKRVYAGRVVISLNEREREKEREFHFFSYWKSAVAHPIREAGKQRSRKRILFETNQGHHFTRAQSSTESSSLLPFSSRFKW